LVAGAFLTAAALRVAVAFLETGARLVAGAFLTAAGVLVNVFVTEVRRAVFVAAVAFRAVPTAAFRAVPVTALRAPVAAFLAVPARAVVARPVDFEAALDAVFAGALDATLDAVFDAVRAAAGLVGAFVPRATPNVALPFTTDLNVELGEKRTPLDAAMRTAAPVWGLRPVRAARRVGLKLPNPTTDTFRPAFTSLMIVYTTALTAFSASRLESAAAFTTASTSSDLFTDTLPGELRNSLHQRGFFP
jgi:hypothetical protein